MKINFFAISSGVIGITTILLGFFVILQGAKRRLYQLWFLFTVAASIWGFGSMFAALTNNSERSLWLWRLTFAFGVAWIPIFFMHFVYEFCQAKINRTPLLFAYASAITFFPLFFSRLFFFATKYIFGSFFYSL